MDSDAIRTQGDGTESPLPSEKTFKNNSQKFNSENDNRKIEKIGKETLSLAQQQSRSSIFYNPRCDNENFNFPLPTQVDHVSDCQLFCI